MKDRSKTVVLVACAVQAVIVAATIGWVAVAGSPVAGTSAGTESAVSADCRESAGEAQAPQSGYGYGSSSDVGSSESRDCDANAKRANTGGDIDISGVGIY